MNIFVLSEQYCPVESARMQCDDHVRKMGIESCQLLATAFDLERLAQDDCPKTQTGNPRKHFNPNHPCGVWARQSTANFDWLLLHTQALFSEYTRRFDKRHFTEDFADWVVINLEDANVPQGKLTSFSIAIGDDKICRNHPDFEGSETYQKYRYFYQYDKPFATWDKLNNTPDWFSLDKLDLEV